MFELRAKLKFKWIERKVLTSINVWTPQYYHTLDRKTCETKLPEALLFMCSKTILCQSKLDIVHKITRIGRRLDTFWIFVESSLSSNSLVSCESESVVTRESEPLISSERDSSIPCTVDSLTSTESDSFMSSEAQFGSISFEPLISFESTVAHESLDSIWFFPNNQFFIFRIILILTKKAQGQGNKELNPVQDVNNATLLLLEKWKPCWLCSFILLCWKFPPETTSAHSISRSWCLLQWAAVCSKKIPVTSDHNLAPK